MNCFRKSLECYRTNLGGINAEATKFLYHNRYKTRLQ